MLTFLLQPSLCSFNFKKCKIETVLLQKVHESELVKGPWRCKIGKYKFLSQFANIFLTYQTFVTNLHFLRVELRWKLKEKLHRVTGPQINYNYFVVLHSFTHKDKYVLIYLMWKSYISSIEVL